MAIFDDIPGKRVPPAVRLQFVVTSSSEPALPAAQLQVLLPATVPPSQIREWVQAGDLPPGTPQEGVCVAQLHPLLLPGAPAPDAAARQLSMTFKSESDRTYGMYD